MTDITRFSPPRGGVDAILQALIQVNPALPAFVYEQLDPISREPLTTWIGLRVEVGSPEPGLDAFSALRRRLDDAARRGPEALIFALVGYPGSSRPTGAQTGYDRFLIALEYVRIDHRRREAEVVRLAEPVEPAWPTLPEWSALLSTAADGLADLAGADPDYDWAPATSAEDFERGVESLRVATNGREHAGAVLSVRVASPLASDAIASYRRLRAINPSTRMFFMRDADLALWGATSLSLVRIRNRHLLAETDGATVRVPDLPVGQRFEWDPTPKELSEYDVVADALREDLRPVTKPGTLRFTREREQRIFFKLGHLFAEAQGDLADDVDDVTVVQALFPHGAAVGHPRREALRLIDALETIERGPFSGAIGVFGADGLTDVASVTRSMWTTPAGTFTQAGAKIVPDSIARQEFDECVIKTKALRDSARQVRTKD